jgi:hypothetical protein
MVQETIEGARSPSEESVQFTTRFADDLEKVEQIAAFCRTECPIQLDSEAVDGDHWLGASGPNESISCLGRITYPIQARFERFLADRLQVLFDTVEPQQWPHLLQILVDSESPFDGEGSKQLRRVTTPEGLRFFEQRIPISLSRKAARLTTDHVFDLLAGFTASDGGAAGYQRELPVIALTDYAVFLETLLIDDLTAEERLRQHRLSSTYSQYLRFTRTIRVAEKLGVRVLLD